MLEDVIKSGDRVLDMGCGSGILSIAAAMLGATDITAVDIDRNAVKTAFENCDKNNITIKGYAGNVLDDIELDQNIGDNYDVIAANIVADIIIAMAPLFKQKLRAGGTLITSGIIEMRADEVKTALLNEGFNLVNGQSSEDWHAFTLVK